MVILRTSVWKFRGLMLLILCFNGLLRMDTQNKRLAFLIKISKTVMKISQTINWMKTSAFVLQDWIEDQNPKSSWIKTSESFFSIDCFSQVRKFSVTFHENGETVFSLLPDITLQLLNGIHRRRICISPHIFCNAPYENVFHILRHRLRRSPHKHSEYDVHVLNSLKQKMQPGYIFLHNQHWTWCTGLSFLRLPRLGKLLHNDCILLRNCTAHSTILDFFRVP